MATGYDAYLRAIKGLESSGRYGITGPTHPKYGRALGAYQVMESNLAPWSQEALGRQVGADEFGCTGHWLSQKVLSTSEDERLRPRPLRNVQPMRRM